MDSTVSKIIKSTGTMENLRQEPLKITEQIIESNQHPYPAIQNSELAYVIDKINADYNKRLQDALKTLMNNSVRTIRKEYDDFQVFIKRLTTVAQVKANTPNYKFKPNIDRDNILVSLSLIPDNGFLTKGIVHIDINDSQKFENVAGDFTDINTLDIMQMASQGYLLKRNKTIDFYTWTSDGTSSSLTIVGFIAWNDLEK